MSDQECRNLAQVLALVSLVMAGLAFALGLADVSGPWFNLAMTGWIICLYLSLGFTCQIGGGAVEDLVNTEEWRAWHWLWAGCRAVFFLPFNVMYWFMLPKYPKKGE